MQKWIYSTPIIVFTYYFGHNILLKYTPNSEVAVWSRDLPSHMIVIFPEVPNFFQVYISDPNWNEQFNSKPVILESPNPFMPSVS